MLMSSVFNEMPPLKYGVLALLVTCLGTLIYRRCLPKPIPGTIPYKKQNAKRILGDAPDVSIR